MSTPKRSPEEIRALMQAGNPGSKPPSLAPGQNPEGSVIRLNLDQIKIYEGNPRDSINPLYHDIKDSIRARRSLQNPLKVTRRPGEALYTLSDGAGTRYRILRELWEETKDEAFFHQDVIYTLYVSESDLLVRHMIENEKRGDMNFWEKARGTWELKAKIEAELGTSDLSLRSLEEELKKRGLTVGRNILMDYRFTTDKLAALGDFRKRLSRNAVRDILSPAWAKLRRLADKFDVSEESYQELVSASTTEMVEVLPENTLDIDIDQLIQGWKDAFATQLQQPVDAVEAMLNILELSPEATRDELQLPEKTESEPAATSAESTQQQLPGTDRQPASASGTGSSTEKESGATKQKEPAPRTDTNPGKAPATQFATFPDTPPANPASQSSLDLGSSDEPGEDDADAPWHDALEVTDDDVDQLRLLRAVTKLARLCQIADCLRFSDALPFWFWIDVPKDEGDGVPMDLRSEHGDGPYRYQAWWLLANLSMSLLPTMQQHIPPSRLLEASSSEEAWTDAVNRTLGEPLYPELMGYALLWAGDPDHLPGVALLELLIAMRQVRSTRSDRFLEISNGHPR